MKLRVLLLALIAALVMPACLDEFEDFFGDYPPVDLTQSGKDSAEPTPEQLREQAAGESPDAVQDEQEANKLLDEGLKTGDGSKIQKARDGRSEDPSYVAAWALQLKAQLLVSSGAEKERLKREYENESSRMVGLVSSLCPECDSEARRKLLLQILYDAQLDRLINGVGDTKEFQELLRAEYCGSSRSLTSTYPGRRIGELSQISFRATAC